MQKQTYIAAAIIAALGVSAIPSSADASGMHAWLQQQAMKNRGYNYKLPNATTTTVSTKPATATKPTTVSTKPTVTTTVGQPVIVTSKPTTTIIGSQPAATISTISTPITSIPTSIPTTTVTSKPGGSVVITQPTATTVITPTFPSLQPVTTTTINIKPTTTSSSASYSGSTTVQPNSEGTVSVKPGHNVTVATGINQTAQVAVNNAVSTTTTGCGICNLTTVQGPGFGALAYNGMYMSTTTDVTTVMTVLTPTGNSSSSSSNSGSSSSSNSNSSYNQGVSNNTTQPSNQAQNNVVNNNNQSAVNNSTNSDFNTLVLEDNGQKVDLLSVPKNQDGIGIQQLSNGLTLNLGQNLQYAKYGNMVKDNGTNRRFFQGQETSEHDMPTSGTATYRGTSIQSVMDNNTFEFTETVVGKSEFDVDFGQKTIKATITADNGQFTPFQRNAVIEGNRIKGTEMATIDGKFYGPGAAELAGSYDTFHESKYISGSFGAAK